MTAPKIKTAVIPAAGLGTRFLPVTKSIPKELIPLAGKPCIQHVIEEAIAAGIEEFVIVSSHEKPVLEHYFNPNPHLNQWLKERGKNDLLKNIESFEDKAKYTFVYQEKPLGLGHAVLCAKEQIKEDYFLVILPDDIIDSEQSVCAQMVSLFSQDPKPLLAVMEVDWDQVHSYGIVQASPISERIGNIDNIIEKPNRKDAPSNLAVIGRYILPKEIFSLLEKTKPGSGGEIQLTDALKMLIDLKGLHSYYFLGERFDTGTPIGLLQASIILAMKDPKSRDILLPLIKTLALTV